MPEIKIVLVTTPELSKLNPLLEEEFFVTKSITNLISNFDIFSELSKELCQKLVIKPTETEFDETVTPIVPFVDQFKEPAIGVPTNLCQEVGCPREIIILKKFL